MYKNSFVLCSLLIAAALSLPARGATIQFLTPAGSPLGIAYGVDGFNVVGEDVLHRGFLYDGTSYKLLSPPGPGTFTPRGISGDKIVGNWGSVGLIYDGPSISTFTHPLGVNGTSLYGIDGNKYVGTYGDASKLLHGFLYDGTSFTTIDFPGAKVTRPFDISGNTIVGSYEDAKNRTHGFLYDGTTYTTLDDPLFSVAGITALQGIDGNKIVGNTSSGPFAAAFLYDGSTFNHPFSVETGIGGDHRFFGISGNRIVGEYNDRPFVYVIPEPSSFLLAALAAAGVLIFARRARLTRWRRTCWVRR